LRTTSIPTAVCPPPSSPSRTTRHRRSLRRTGSVPVERLYNAIDRDDRPLFDAVIGIEHRHKHRALCRIMAKHPDVFAFTQDAEKPRVRLVVHFAWRCRDDHAAADRVQRETRTLTALWAYLWPRPSGTAPVDDFVAQHQRARGWPAMPHRGDIIRFVRRHSRVFRWDPQRFTVTLLCRSPTGTDRGQSARAAGTAARRTGRPPRAATVPPPAAVAGEGPAV
jgi:hypothetical protein